jgi:hypothetical protein
MITPSHEKWTINVCNIEIYDGIRGRPVERTDIKVRVSVIVTLRLAVYLPLVRLDTKKTSREI